MENFIAPEEVKLQIEELKKIVHELIIVSKDGTAKPRPGVSDEQMRYALEEMRNIKSTFEDLTQRRQEYNQSLDKHHSNFEKVRQSGNYFMEKYGKSFFPAWYRKFLNL